MMKHLIGFSDLLVITLIVLHSIGIGVSAPWFVWVFVGILILGEMATNMENHKTVKLLRRWLRKRP